MDDVDLRRELRGAVYRGDVVAILALLPKMAPADCLQLGGDGLLLALDEDASGAKEQSRAWVGKLRERDWAGDAELADEFAARLGTGVAPTLRPLPVDLDQLSDVLEGDPAEGGGRIDLRTGEVWPQYALEYEREMRLLNEDDEDDEAWWIPVGCEGSRHGYRDMQHFVDALPDPDRRDRLEIALQGRGAFRRFRDVLARWPDDFRWWSAFADERRRGRARAWLAGTGYRVAPRREHGEP